MAIRILFVIAVAVVVAALIMSRPGRISDAGFLKWTGFTIVAASTLVFGAVVIGETIADPGGWKAAGLIAAWVIPLIGLAGMAGCAPEAAARVLPILALTMIATSIWFAVDSPGWRSFEDDNLPVRAVITLAVTAAIAVLGLTRTAEAGVLLLITGAVPVAISALGSLSGIGSLAAVSSAAVVAGVLYLRSAYVTGASQQARADAVARPDAG